VNPPSRYFAGTGALFTEAARRLGLREHTYRIGGHDIVVRAAGDALVERTHPALARPAAAPANDPTSDDVDVTRGPSLVVDMWDSVRSGVPIGSAPWGADDFRPLGLVEPYCTDRFLTAVDVHTASLSLYDRHTSRAHFWLEDAEHMAYWQSASPLRLILSWWASTLGMQLTHVAAVAGPCGAVLLVGGAGAGKSTTSLSCVAGGLRFLGDDYCMLDPSPEPTVHRVYATAKLRPDAFTRLPALRPLARNAARLDREKAVLDLLPTFADSLAESEPVRAIVIPRVTGRFATRPASAGAVLRAMAPSTVFGLFGATGSSLANLARLSRTVPGYEVELGDDVQGVVDTIGKLVS
jgi:hypothetical protein